MATAANCNNCEASVFRSPKCNGDAVLTWSFRIGSGNDVFREIGSACVANARLSSTWTTGK